MIGFGVIGCGDVSDRYCEGAQYCQNTKLVIVIDKLKDVAKNCGEKFGVAYTDNIEDILNNKDIDAVVVATPHYLHAPITIQSAKAGKHVMCDKPIATTLSDARKMIKECHSAGVKLGINFAMRYQSNNLKAKELIAEGVIGKIVDIKMSSFFCREPSYWTQGYRKKVVTDWRGNKEKSGGGVLIMNFSHYIDLVRFVTGLEVEEAFSVYGSFNSPEGVEVEDTVNATLKFNNGALGSINTSTAAYGGSENSICIMGTKGQIMLLCDPMKVYTTVNYPKLIQNQWNEIKSKDKCWSYYLMMEDFAKAIIEDKESPITAEEGLKCLEVVVAIYKSGEINGVAKVIGIPSALGGKK